jgi:hypothetical protein
MKASISGNGDVPRVPAVHPPPPVPLRGAELHATAAPPTVLSVSVEGSAQVLSDGLPLLLLSPMLEIMAVDGRHRSTFRLALNGTLATRELKNNFSSLTAGKVHRFARSKGIAFAVFELRNSRKFLLRVYTPSSITVLMGRGAPPDGSPVVGSNKRQTSGSEKIGPQDAAPCVAGVGV